MQEKIVTSKIFPFPVEKLHKGLEAKHVLVLRTCTSKGAGSLFRATPKQEGKRSVYIFQIPLGKDKYHLYFFGKIQPTIPEIKEAVKGQEAYING